MTTKHMMIQFHEGNFLTKAQKLADDIAELFLKDGEKIYVRGEPNFPGLGDFYICIWVEGARRMSKLLLDMYDEGILEYCPREE